MEEEIARSLGIVLVIAGLTGFLASLFTGIGYIGGVDVPGLEQLYASTSIFRSGGRYYIAVIREYVVSEINRFPGYNYTVSLKIDLSRINSSKIVDKYSGIIVFYGSVKREYIASISLFEDEDTILSTIISRLKTYKVDGEKHVEILYSTGKSGYTTVIVLIPLNMYTIIDIPQTIPPIVYYPARIPRSMPLIKMINESRRNNALEHVLKYLVEKASSKIIIDANIKARINTGITLWLRSTGLLILSLPVLADKIAPLYKKIYQLITKIR